MRKRITTSAISVVLLAANLCLAGYAAQEGQTNRPTASGGKSPTGNESQSVVLQQTAAQPMSAEEKLIRNAYVKLMRYHSAALDELAARTGRENRPEDYVTFEIRNVHTGPVQELAGKDLAEFVTSAGGGEVLKVTRHHLKYKHGPKHAFYDVEWAVPQGFAEEKPGAADESVRADLESGDKIETYSAYQVTVRLAGRERSYSAMAVFPSGWSITLGGRVKILDSVTARINDVSQDQSPQIHSPWTKYVKSDSYAAVARTIRETREAGEPLIPANRPVGYLPGDDVPWVPRDTQMVAAAACAGKSVDITFDQYVNDGASPTFNVTVSGGTPQAYKWSYNAPSGAGNNPNVTFQLSELRECDNECSLVCVSKPGMHD